jgi:hypothetical protein
MMRAMRGHVLYDYVVLLCVAGLGFLYAAGGAARGSWPLMLAGGAGLLLTAFVLLRAVLAGPFERLAGPRLTAWGERLDDVAGEAFMGLFVLYLAGPLVVGVLKGVLTPFRENGFGEGLKICLALAGMVGAAWGFLAALSRFGWLRRALVFLLVFGLCFGAAAFVTGLFLADGWPLGRLYGVLAVEALACAAVSAAALRGAGSDD